MGDFFAKISGQFAAPLLLSALFPVLMFSIGLALVVLPITPYGQEVTSAVRDPKYWQDHGSVALALTVMVLMCSVLLYYLNATIIRLYEGDYWQDTWVGRWFVRRCQRHYDRVDSTRNRIKQLRLVMRLAFPKDTKIEIPKLIDAQAKLAMVQNFQYPNERELLLPTRLGNAIQAFETWSTRLYRIPTGTGSRGVPGSSVWPRLKAIMDSNLAQSIDSVKTMFDFMIHCSFLSAILGVLTAASGLYWKTGAVALSFAWIPWVAGFAALSYVFYLGSIRKASEWGSQVTTAFDLYRLPLLTKLGYEVKPTDLADEQRIWENVDYKLTFPDDPAFPDLPYTTPESAVVAEPNGTLVSAQRELAFAPDGSVEIRLTVTNDDPAAWPADRVTVYEKIPSGMTYVAGSAQLGHGHGPATLRSVQPLVIDLDALGYGQKKELSYRIKKAAP